MGGSVGLRLSLILSSLIGSCLSVGGAAALSLLSSALVYSVWRIVIEVLVHQGVVLTKLLRATILSSISLIVLL